MKHDTIDEWFDSCIPIEKFLDGLIDKDDPVGVLRVKCPECGGSVLFDQESTIEEMLVFCIGTRDNSCSWVTRLNALRTATLRALHGTTD